MFVVFEGGEGSGKSTQAKSLRRRLQRLNLASTLVRDPGGTAIGKRMERWLKNSRDVPARTELLLFAAARALLTEEVIRPALKAGMVVICDRYAPSTTAYQGYGRGLDLRTVETINDLATGGLQPDMLVLLDIRPEAGLARKGAGTPDRFQQESLAFHRKVREGYLKLAADDPQRWLVLDGTMPHPILRKLIWGKVRATLQRP